MNRLFRLSSRGARLFLKNKTSKAKNNSPSSLRKALNNYYARSLFFGNQKAMRLTPVNKVNRAFFSQATQEAETETAKEEKEEEKYVEEEEDYEEDYNEDGEDEVEEDAWWKKLPIKSFISLGLILGFYNYFSTRLFQEIDEPLYKIIFEKVFGFLYKPELKRFLPDPVPIHKSFARKTLIIGFENMLYHKNYEAGKGITIDLRPGLRKFLEDISSIYEVVLFSDEDTGFMEEVIHTIDPYKRFLKYGFGREFFSMHQGKFMKDYSYINRDFSNVVIVDFTEHSNFNMKENLILMKPYEGEDYDDSLEKLHKFLKFTHRHSDVRNAISSQGGFEAIQTYNVNLNKKIQKIKNKKGFLEKLFGKF